MPPRWPRKPDRADPAYRKLDDRMNFATHVALFSAINSGLWFFRMLGTSSELSTASGFSGTPLVTEIWGVLLLAHGLWLFAIAKYPDPELASLSDSAAKGFQPKTEKTSTKSVKSTKR